jgi:hypothetical protein
LSAVQVEDCGFARERIDVAINHLITLMQVDEGQADGSCQLEVVVSGGKADELESAG